MKKTVLILGLCLSLCANARAEIYRDIDVDMVYKNGTFKDKAEVKELIDEYTQRDTPNDPQKNVVSNVIDDYYQHPEYIPIIEAKCQESMPWIKGSFDLWEEPYFRADMCLTWETNKKLDKEQIELLAHLKKTWNNVITNMALSDGILTSFNTTFDNNNEYSLQLAVRIYNLVMKENWPECRIETGKKIGDSDIHIEPCNTPSEIMKLCSSADNPQNCMQEEIISRISKFKIMTNVWATEEEKQKEREEMENKRINDMKWLMQLTQKIIPQLIEDKNRQKKEIMRLYNFYWLSILRSYKDSLDDIEANS
jgi:hypothetical protein